MNKELMKLKKELIKFSTPTKEEQISKALRTIFQDTNEITDKESFSILGWEYETKEELYNQGIDIEKVRVCNLGDNGSMVINANFNNKIDVEGINVLNMVSASRVKNKIDY